MRSETRTNGNKAFNVPINSMQGFSNIQKYTSDPEFKEAQDMQRTCTTLGRAYADIMVSRLTTLEPDYFENASMSESKFKLHLVDNFCSETAKHQAV